MEMSSSDVIGGEQVWACIGAARRLLQLAGGKLAARLFD